MKVKFLPGGEEFDIAPNETILHLAQANDIHIQSVCKGLPSCAECKVNIVDGEHHVLPPSSKEIALIGTAHYVDLSRLSCQLRCFGDVTVNLAEQIEKQERMGRKAKDRGRRDGKESQAVLGSIVEESTDFDETLEAASANTEKRRPQKHKSLDNKKAFYGGFLDGEEEPKSGRGRSGNRNKKNRGKKKKKAGGRGQGSGRSADSKAAQSSPGASESSGGAGKKKRSRRRKRKPKGDGASGSPKASS